MSPPGPNLVALLTPPGVAGVATVRLCGSGVAAFAGRHLSRPLAIHRCVHCELRDGGTLLDDPVAVLVDDLTLDLSLHGSPWIVQRTIDLAQADGFTLVSFRDLPGDAGDEIEAQVLRDLPRAMTPEALRILLAQPTAWRQMIDTHDTSAIHRARHDRSLHWLLNPPTVAIVGIPNVGKSTLANQLFARQHSITADLPGTTRDWVGEQANIDGLVVTLIDTPGVRQTDDPIEAAAIGRAESVVRTADLIIELFDVTQPRALQPRRFEHSVAVANKSDADARWHDDSMLRTSARTGAGTDAIRARIRAFFGCNDLESLHARAWTTAQRASLAGDEPIDA